MTPEPSWLSLAAAVALFLLLLGLVLWLTLTEQDAVAARFSRPVRARTRRSRRPSRAAFGGPAPAAEPRRVAVVVNPTKFSDVTKVRRVVERVCAQHGWAAPLWLETTLEDPGTGQTEQALAAGVDLVCAFGGDGTVRTVGTAMIGTGVPMGLLPRGTGNLLARNLRIPVDRLPGDRLEAALTVALTGRNARIDTCSLVLTRPTAADLARAYDDDTAPADYGDRGDDRPSTPVTEQHTFLVMAGLGFDAEVMAGTQDDLKSWVGWPAYVVSGAKHLRGAQFRVDVVTDSGEAFHRRVRSVIVGNVGRLQGGMELLPAAEVDDGQMDVVLLSPKGIVGWGAVAAQLATKQRKGHGRIDHLQARTIRVRSNKPVGIQLDGDTLGVATAMEVTVTPGSLIVRRQP